IKFAWMPARSSRPACPASSWRRKTPPALTTKSLSPGGRIAQRCCHHEIVALAAQLSARPARVGDSAAVYLAGALVAGAVLHCPENQFFRVYVWYSSLWTAGTG